MGRLAVRPPPVPRLTLKIRGERMWVKCRNVSSGLPPSTLHDMAAFLEAEADALRMLANEEEPEVCDCENPEPTNGGAALVSNECPVHNLFPRRKPDEA